jgi:hypothetical protein
MVLVEGDVEADPVDAVLGDQLLGQVCGGVGDHGDALAFAHTLGLISSG